MNDSERAALVEELAEAMHERSESKYDPKDRTPWRLLDEFYRKDVRDDAEIAVMPIIDRLLADRSGLVDALASSLKERLSVDALEGLDRYARAHDLVANLVQRGADAQASGATVAPEEADSFTRDLLAIGDGGRTERFARVAMLGAVAIEEIPHINGVLAVATYERWSDTWLRTLTSEDMTYARGVMGIAEPKGADDEPQE